MGLLYDAHSPSHVVTQSLPFLASFLAEFPTAAQAMSDLSLQHFSQYCVIPCLMDFYTAGILLHQHTYILVYLENRIGILLLLTQGVLIAILHNFFFKTSYLSCGSKLSRIFATHIPMQQTTMQW